MSHVPLRVRRLVHWTLPTLGLVATATAWGALTLGVSASVAPAGQISGEAGVCHRVGPPVVATDRVWWLCSGAPDTLLLRLVDYAAGTLTEIAAPVPAVVVPNFSVRGAVLSPSAAWFVVGAERGPLRLWELRHANGTATARDIAVLHGVASSALRGVAWHDGSVELALEDCRTVRIAASGEITWARLRGCPHERGAEDVSVEQAVRSDAGWRYLYSREKWPASRERGGIRSLWSVSATAAPTALSDVILTTLTPPYGEWLDVAPGGVVNGSRVPAFRFAAGRLQRLPAPPGAASARREPGSRALVRPHDADPWALTPWRVGPRHLALELPGDSWLWLDGSGADGALYSTVQTHSGAAIDGAIGGRLSPAARAWWPATPVLAPRSDGGWWLGDTARRYIALSATGERLDAPDDSARIARVLDDPRRQILFLLFGFAVVFVGWAVARVARGGSPGRWVAGPRYLLQVGSAVYLLGALLCVPAFLDALANA